MGIRSKKSPKLSSAVRIAVIYTVVMGIGMAISKEIFGFNYGTLGMALVFLPIMAGLTVYSVAASSKLLDMSPLIFGKTSARKLLWFAPWAILMTAMTIEALPKIAAVLTDSAATGQLAVIFATMLFVGIGEELVFRGVLLRVFLQNGYRYGALLASALGFSLLHAVNIFGGQTLQAIGIQLLITFLFGLAWAPLALRIHTLLPLIIYHFLWDAFAFGQHIFGPLSPYYFIADKVLLIVMGIALWLTAKQDFKNQWHGFS